MWTDEVGVLPWDVGRLALRVDGPDDLYVLIVTRDGRAGISKKRRGQWLPWLVKAETGIDPLEPHVYRVSARADRFIVAIDGVEILRYADRDDPIWVGHIGLHLVNARATIDGIRVRER